jgi:valyl-tRNA synthetase
LQKSVYFRPFAMSETEIAKAYESRQVESRWYQAWQDAHAFAGKVDVAREPFCIVIPPPNVTGVLTMGHVLNNTIQDILVRRARQEGKAALWLPGTDHAGLATQTRVEKELRKEGLDRRKMGREKFFQRVVEWRDKHGGIIIEQLKRLGASCDWDRTVHTLDGPDKPIDYSRAVLTAFVKLYQRKDPNTNEPYIYRGKRMVNWCPASLTALSDEEVVSKPQKGLLYHMRYEIVERPGEFLHIATTRPETLMGDTAVAVHPEDARYTHLHGCHVWRPFPRAEIPIIFDTAVDKDFGSGALKVTPAHDRVDFEIGQRHKLPIIDVLNPDGTLNALAGEEFAGMDRFKARKIAAKKLEEMGLLTKAEPYENNVGFSERADVPIEPRLSEQWFLRYPRIAEAKAAVRDGHIQFWPAHWSKVYLNWLEKIQDWCISRQVWWGHRIPVWYKKGLDRAKLTPTDYEDPTKVHVSVKGPADPENWEQEEDSLDTWASSWLWPFATLGWPDGNAKQQEELKFWYPTNDLVTGPDIIFFWVARMIIAGLTFMPTEEEQKLKELPAEVIKRCIPFKNVYFTGIIRDKQGRKMSKSLGNSPDPIDLIDKFGADGLRFGTMNSAPQGNDILFDEANVELGRNFCNKLWNAARFRQMQGPTDKNGSLAEIVARIEPDTMDDFDRGIIICLRRVEDPLKRAFDNYEFNAATQALHAFFWGDFCDCYVEVAKVRGTDPAAKTSALAIQDLCLRQTLLHLHPFMPFITEELWHGLGFGTSTASIQNVSVGQPGEFMQTLIARGIPIDDPSDQFGKSYLNMGELREWASCARTLKANNNLAARRDVTFYFSANTIERQELVQNRLAALQHLAGAKEIKMLSLNASAPDGTVSTVMGLGTIYLDIAGSVDKGAERIRLGKEIEKLSNVIANSEAKLANEAFVSKAPAKVIEGAKAQLAENVAKREELKRLLAALG